MSGRFQRDSMFCDIKGVPGCCAFLLEQLVSTSTHATPRQDEKRYNKESIMKLVLSQRLGCGQVSDLRSQEPCFLGDSTWQMKFGELHFDGW